VIVSKHAPSSLAWRTNDNVVGVPIIDLRLRRRARRFFMCSGVIVLIASFFTI
jgi:hypothetical protein